jgi:AmmeMemoRadiSam system protein A
MSSLDESIRRRLLYIARSALAADLSGNDDPSLDEISPCLAGHGVFVTLRKGQRLRGCIGTFEPTDDLAAMIRRMAVAAAGDPRFTGSPISAAELPEIRIELSLLSPLERLGDPALVEIGRHGIYLKHPEGTGCFLPEVASERNWSREEFLSRCCTEKAGLDAFAWRRSEMELFVFTVEKIAEE